jgi:phospholipase C
VNGLGIALLNNNPNLNPLNGAGAANPFRFDRSQANTQDMDHDYMAEQLAFDGGAMDLFPANTGTQVLRPVLRRQPCSQPVK